MENAFDSKSDQRRPSAVPSTYFCDGIACATIVFLVLLLGVYCCALNALLYTHKAPFYDSMSYNQAMASTMSDADQRGTWPALTTSCKGSTVFVPSIVASTLGPYLSPSRFIGVWLQTVELMAFELSLYYLFRRVCRASSLLSLVYSLPFLSFACLYQYNGGLSDLRMDLSLMLMFGTTAVWYFISSATQKYLHYCVLGGMAGIAILFRATAPAYFVVALGPCVLLELIFFENRWRRVWRLLVATLVAFGVGGWFLIANYDYLHYYYAVWNIDAQANLPLRESIRHVSFSLRHVGEVLVYVLAAILLIAFVGRLIARMRVARDEQWDRRRLAIQGLQLLWVAVAPAWMLVIRGAGLNPFVSMSSSIGIGMLLAIPAVALLAETAVQGRQLFLMVLFASMLIRQSYVGLCQHAPTETNSMGAHIGVLLSMVQDARERGAVKLRYGVAHCAEMTTMSLHNVVVFDRLRVQSAFKDQPIHLEPDFLLSRYAPAEWDTVEGADMEAKIAHLVRESSSSTDYLVIPEPATAEYLKTALPHVVTDKYALEIRTQLLGSGQWAPCSDVIEVLPNEQVRVYRNVSQQ